MRASPFDATLGLIVETATADVVEAYLDVNPDVHTQPAGLVHGGVYCAIVESVASLGATLSASADHPELRAVGIENHTSFLRPVRSGRLRAVAKPVSRGRQTHLWEVLITDEAGRSVARGSVRLSVVELRS